MDKSKNFLGCGWTYPVGVEKASGRVRLALYEDDIEQAIRIILSTRRNERLMRPDFGSGLHEFLFDNDSYGTRARIRQATEEALRLWEPRVKDVDVEVDFPNGSTGGFVLNISYTVRSTNNPFNLVYPYFLTESV